MPQPWVRGALCRSLFKNSGNILLTLALLSWQLLPSAAISEENQSQSGQAAQELNQEGVTEAGQGPAAGPDDLRMLQNQTVRLGNALAQMHTERREMLGNIKAIEQQIRQLNNMLAKKTAIPGVAALAGETSKRVDDGGTALEGEAELSQEPAPSAASTMEPALATQFVLEIPGAVSVMEAADAGEVFTPEETAQTESPALRESTDENSDGAESWAVRVGTFREKQNAERVFAALREWGLEPQQREIEFEGGAAVRIWLGPFSSRKEADQTAARLSGLTGEQGYITRIP